jgi:hypothetical protein
MQGFALQELPRISVALIMFDMNAIFDESNTVRHQLTPFQLQGNESARLDVNLSATAERFFTSGRVFHETGR